MILEAGRGVLQKKRDSNEKRERTKTEVSSPAQTRDYCKTFHLIDKENGAEANYDLGGKSRLHNWLPKLIFRLYNMLLNNAYKMYNTLVKQHTPERMFFGHGQCREGIDARPMPKGSGNVEAKGRASERDAGHAKNIWLDHRPEGLLGR